MNKKEIQNALIELQEEELELLKKHRDISFPTEEEIKNYIQENLMELSRLKEVQREIRDLEWQLMSSKEQQELLDYYDKIKEKYSDE